MPSACALDAGPPPDRFDQTYVLATVNGRSLPAAVRKDDGTRYILIADTLRFARDGSVIKSHTFRRLSASYQPHDTVYHSTYELRYRVQGRRVIMDVPCPINANCIGGEQGTIIGPVLVVDQPMIWPDDRLLIFRSSDAH